MIFKRAFGFLFLGSALFLSTLSFALEVGDQAPCVKLDLVQSNNSLSFKCIADFNQTTQKYTILEFSATTCPACVSNFPVFNDLAKQVEGSAVARTVMLDKKRQVILDYIKKNKTFFDHEVALDDTREATKGFDILYTPTIFILDDTKKIVYKHIGTLDTTDVDEIVELVTK